MKILKLYNIIADEGVRTFLHLIREKLDARKDDDARYQEYIRRDEPRINEKYMGTDVRDVLEVIHWNEQTSPAQLLELVQKSEQEYIGLLHTSLRLHRDGRTIINHYIAQKERRGTPADVIYGNEDCMEEQTGRRSNPVFRPERSMDTLISYNYIGDFACIKKERLKTCLEQMEEQSPALLYEILLRLVLDESVLVDCIHTVLVHRLIEETERKQPEQVSQSGIGQNQPEQVSQSGIGQNQPEQARQSEIGKNQSSQAALACMKQGVLEAQGIHAEIRSHGAIQHGVIQHGAIQHGVMQHEAVQYADYEYRQQLVSIIIPSKDHPELLGMCLDSIRANTPHAAYEIIVVDNGSDGEHERQYRARLKEYGTNTSYIYEKMDFNFAKMCNIGAAHASGELLLFLNDDIEILPQEHCTQTCQDWLEILAGQALQKNIGAVGAKLMYPGNQRIQHIGVVNYENAGLAHIYARHEDNDEIKDYRNIAVYNYLCVTGACLMVQRSRFQQIGGFDERLAVTHNDIDVCFHLHQQGYRVVQRNDVVLVHHESFSRGMDEQSKEKELRNMKERDYLYSKYPVYERWDPYYSPCLTQLEFDSQINPDIYSVIYHKPEKISLEEAELQEQLPTDARAEITSCQFREDLQIRGYVYEEHGREKDWTDPYMILYNHKNAYRCRAQSISDRVFHERKGLDRHINYAPFFCGIQTSDMEQGEYRIKLSTGRIVMDGQQLVTI